MAFNPKCKNRGDICHIVRNSTLSIKHQLNEIIKSKDTKYKQELCNEVICELSKIEGALELITCSG